MSNSEIFVLRWLGRGKNERYSLRVAGTQVVSKSRGWVRRLGASAKSEKTGDKNRKRAGREWPARTPGAAPRLVGKLREPRAMVSRKNSFRMLESISLHATEVK